MEAISLLTPIQNSPLFSIEAGYSPQDVARFEELYQGACIESQPSIPEAAACGFGQVFAEGITSVSAALTQKAEAFKGTCARIVEDGVYSPRELLEAQARMYDMTLSTQLASSITAETSKGIRTLFTNQ